MFGPLFHHDLVNADAHPGNFVVLDDDRLGLLDFGAVLAFDHEVVVQLGELLRSLVDPAGHDVVRRMEDAGIGMRRPDRVVLVELVELMAAPLRGTTDFATDRSLEAIGAFKQRHPVAMLRFEADPHLLPVFRAIVGVYHALKHLRVEADVGAALVELLAES